MCNRSFTSVKKKATSNHNLTCFHYKRLTLRSDLLAAAPNFVPKPRPDPLAEDLNIFSGVLQLDFFNVLCYY